jgi:hypothetical protein
MQVRGRWPHKLHKQGWTINETAGSAYFSFDIKIKFKKGGEYDPKCCRYLQWVQAKATINGVSVPDVAGLPLDGHLHVDRVPYTNDGATDNGGIVGYNQSTDPTVWFSYDEPGIQGGLTKGDQIDWWAVFKGTVIDTCNGNTVVTGATQSFKVQMNGEYPSLSTSP